MPEVSVNKQLSDALMRIQILEAGLTSEREIHAQALSDLAIEYVSAKELTDGVVIFRGCVIPGDVLEKIVLFFKEHWNNAKVLCLPDGEFEVVEDEELLFSQFERIFNVRIIREVS